MNYTTIEQSKKLLELGLSPESADMYYFKQVDPDYFPPDVESIKPTPFVISIENKPYYTYDIPCWSVVSLLNLMICPKLEEYIKGKWDLTTFTDESLKTPIEVQDCESAVNACYEMILKLHEQKLL